jgi:transposase
MPAQRLAYATDLPDEEWHMLAPLLPPAKPAGRPLKYAIREVMHGIPYVLRAGCAWRLMPHDLPHGQTAYQTFRAWRQDGTWRRIHDQLRERVRPQMGRHPQPSAAIIDAQTVKTTEQGGRIAMAGPSNLMAAHAISSVRRRGSACVSSSTPPICEMPPWPHGRWPPRTSAVLGSSASGLIWPLAASGSTSGWKRRAVGL